MFIEYNISLILKSNSNPPPKVLSVLNTHGAHTLRVDGKTHYEYGGERSSHLTTSLLTFRYFRCRADWYGETVLDEYLTKLTKDGVIVANHGQFLGYKKRDDEFMPSLYLYPDRWVEPKLSD